MVWFDYVSYQQESHRQAKQAYQLTNKRNLLKTRKLWRKGLCACVCICVCVMYVCLCLCVCMCVQVQAHTFSTNTQQKDPDTNTNDEKLKPASFHYDHVF